MGYRDKDFRLAQAERHNRSEAYNRKRQAPAEGALRRREIDQLRADEHKRDVARFYRGDL